MMVGNLVVYRCTEGPIVILGEQVVLLVVGVLLPHLEQKIQNTLCFFGSDFTFLDGSKGLMHLCVDA